MAFNIDDKGNITLIQGDSGSLTIEGIHTDKNYTLFLAIQDQNRKPIGEELKINSNKSDKVVFELTGDFTDLLKVSPNEDFAIYYYGIKQCFENSLEDTLLIGNNQIGYSNTITVFPKKVEGM